MTKIKKNKIKSTLQNLSTATINTKVTGSSTLDHNPVLSLNLTQFIFIFFSLLLMMIFYPAYNFNRWDNYETFTIQTIYAHSLWLKGFLPIINIHQNLGQPIMGNGQSGALYLPFTIGVLILKLLGLSFQILPNLMSVFHISVGVIGWKRFFEKLGIDSDFSFLGAASLLSSGFFILGSQIWQHIGPEVVWMGWVLFWFKQILDSAPKSHLWFSITWFLFATSSHIQYFIYFSLQMGLFMVLTILLSGDQKINYFKRSLIPFLWMCFLSLPTFSYSLQIKEMSQRSEALSESIFFEASLPVQFLMGLITPFFETGEYFFDSQLTYFTFGGFFISTALIVFILKLFSIPKIKSNHSRNNEKTNLIKNPNLIILFFLMILFLDFSLGKNGFIYPLTKSIPIWSSMRWPYKFTIQWIVMLIPLSLLILQERMDTKNPQGQSNAFLYISAGVGLFSFLMAQPESVSQFGYYGTHLCALFFIVYKIKNPGFLKIIFLNSKRSSLLISPLIGLLLLLFSIGVSLEKTNHGFNKEVYGDYGLSYFGVDANESLTTRLATLKQSGCALGQCDMQIYSNFDSATANNYLALSGHVMGMAPQNFSQYIVGNAWGVLQPGLMEHQIGSALFRHLGVKYYLVGREQQLALNALITQKELQLKNIKSDLIVYEDPKAKGIVSVIEHVEPLDKSLPVTLRIFEPQSSKGIVFTAEGLDQTIESQNTSIKNFEWVMGRGLRVDVDNSSQRNSFVFVSLFAFPFVKATLDGQPITYYPTQFVGGGVIVPPGSHHVEVLASPWPLFVSFLIAILSLLAGFLVLKKSKSYI